MSTLRRHSTLSSLILMNLLVISIGLTTQLWADESAAERLRQHLAVGEFGVAKAIAARDLHPAQRAAWLERIAHAQAAGGARRASLLTAASIPDGHHRAKLMGDIRRPMGRRGGGVEPDWDALIDMIKTTIAPETWDDAGGNGSISEGDFPGGVYVDANGQLQKLVTHDNWGRLATLHTRAKQLSANRDADLPSPLRIVSLTRLEREAQMRWASQQEIDDTMHSLAGLNRIQYLLVFPKTGDIAIAGPAGAWNIDDEGRWVSEDSGRPVLRLDDLVVLLRNAMGTHQGRFSCSIDPVRENLAKTQQYLKKTGKSKLRAGRRAREKWLTGLQDTLGEQNIRVEGIDPGSRAARVLVEADYRMKLVGMGLEETTTEVVSYLDSIELGPGQSPPPLSVLRWWFTLNYEAIRRSKSGHAFELVGPGVKVLSENELLTLQGERQPTGQSEELSSRFARSFTENFQQLAIQYPIYAELRNLFDLALAAAIIRNEDLAGQVGWQLAHFGVPEHYQIQLERPAKTVRTVVNHRIINRVHIVAGVSGGISVNTQNLVSSNGFVSNATHQLLDANHHAATPQTSAPERWWWDAK